jgi:hypothetical protein
MSEVTYAMFAQGAKLAKALTDEESKQLVSGEARLAVVPRGHRVIEDTAILNRVLRLLQRLSPEEIQQIEDGVTKLVPLRRGEKVSRSFDPTEVAEAVTRCTTEGEIIRLLNGDSSVSAANLKKVATELNLPVPATVKTKSAIQSYIAENVVRDRARWSLR